MTQHDLTIDNDSRPSVRADFAAGLQALGSTSKGNARPLTVYAGQQWLDDNTPSGTTWSWYFWTGSADIKVGELNTTTNLYTPFVNGASILAGPAFTGTPSAPTAAGGTNTTQLATTAFVTSAVSPKAPLAAPTFTGTPSAPTAAPGTNTTQLATTAFVVAAVAASGKYHSGNQTITGYGSLTLAHGLAAEPTGLTTWLKCVVAENGYVIGDKLFMPGALGTSGASADVGHAIVVDATNAYVRFGATYVALNKTTGAGVLLTNANWRLVVEATA